MMQKHIFFLSSWFIIVFNFIPQCRVKTPRKFVLFKELVRSGTVTGDNPVAGLSPLKILECPFPGAVLPKDLPMAGKRWQAACSSRTSNSRSKDTEELVSERKTFIIKLLCHCRTIIFNPLKKISRKMSVTFHWHTLNFCGIFKKIISVWSPLWPNISPFNAICFLSSQFPINSAILLLIQIFTYTFPGGSLWKSRQTISAVFLFPGKPAVVSGD